MISDYKCAHAFLYAYKENQATFNAYRRDVERLLLWSWVIHNKSILELRRADMELYLKFCTNPPLSWIGIKKAPHFSDVNGERKAHADWRPFVKTITKIAAKESNLDTHPSIFPKVGVFKQCARRTRRRAAKICLFDNKISNQVASPYPKLTK